MNIFKQSEWTWIFEVVWVFILFDAVCIFAALFYGKIVVEKKRAVDETNKSVYRRALLEAIGNINTNVYRCIVLVDKMDKSTTYADQYRMSFEEEIKKAPQLQGDAFKNLEESDKKAWLDLEKLKDPPILYRSVYLLAREYYDLYSRIYGMVVSPQGALMNYDERINRLIADSLRRFGLLQVEMGRLRGNG